MCVFNHRARASLHLCSRSAKMEYLRKFKSTHRKLIFVYPRADCRVLKSLCSVIYSVLIFSSENSRGRLLRREDQRDPCSSHPVRGSAMKKPASCVPKLFTNCYPNVFFLYGAAAHGAGAFAHTSTSSHNAYAHIDAKHWMGWC